MGDVVVVVVPVGVVPVVAGAMGCAGTCGRSFLGV